MIVDHATIAAPATPSGRGGIGVVRVSGPKVRELALAITPNLQPRHAHFASLTEDGEIIDHGLLLFFPGPHSYTGEDVLEFQGHGSPYLVNAVTSYFIRQGCRMAQPGEFTQRAFLSGRIDLLQAEAVADLIAANHAQEAKAAMRSLEGVFSKVTQEADALILQARTYAEACLDFPDEEVDWVGDPIMIRYLEQVKEALVHMLQRAEHGVRLRSGVQAVFMGPPNVGKSALFNHLSGRDEAIVTEHAGTTRDVLKSSCLIGGMTLDLLDTAGLRETDDPVERLGIARTQERIKKADVVLLMLDLSRHCLEDYEQQMKNNDLSDQTIIRIANKADLCSERWEGVFCLSAQTGEGVDVLIEHLQSHLQSQSAMANEVTARTRHVEGVHQSLLALERAEQALTHGALEMVAEFLKQAHDALSGMIGSRSHEDVLDEIFSSFCIGK